jgi:hypothetical protein
VNPDNDLCSTIAWVLLLTTLTAAAQTGLIETTNGPGSVSDGLAQNAQARMKEQRAEQLRALCINSRRVICGKVIQILSDGLVVESGYTSLMNPPFNKSWRISGTVSVNRDATAVELNSPGAPCIGQVFLTNYPKRPALKLYDYVSIVGYPAGQYTYAPVPRVKKTIRRFAASLAMAVKFNLELPETHNASLLPETK